MAIDTKSQHVGNHGGSYLDNEGQTKQFTYIDHDKKTTISAGLSVKQDFTAFFSEYRADLIKRIVDLPASICPTIFQDYTVRGEGKVVITWNTDMLIDNGCQLSQLRDLCVLLENTALLMKLTV